MLNSTIPHTGLCNWAEMFSNPSVKAVVCLVPPGDLTPPSRLVRAATLTHFADPVKTSDEAVNLAIHILNTVDIPHGVADKDYTNWIVAKDLTHKALYYRTYNDLTVRVIYLDKVQPQGKMLKLPLSTPVGGFKDTTDELETVNGGHTEL